MILGLSLGGATSGYKGLPCPYASCVLASTCLLTKGNTFILCCMASLMILFMIDQSCYPHDEILDSDNWKKIVYIGGEFKHLPPSLWSLRVTTALPPVICSHGSFTAESVVTNRFQKQISKHFLCLMSENTKCTHLHRELFSLCSEFQCIELGCAQ